VSLEQSNIIDALGLDQSTGRITLIIRHDAPGDGADSQLFLLQEKLNAYLSFALDGEMAEAYPAFINHPLTLRIDTASTPDTRTLHLLTHVRRQLEFQEINLEVRITSPSDIPDSGPSHDCAGGCHSH
jgi:hypothetical protein